MIGRWVIVTGKRRERGVLIAFYLADRVTVTVTACSPERTTRGMCARSGDTTVCINIQGTLAIVPGCP